MPYYRVNKDRFGIRPWLPFQIGHLAGTHPVGAMATVWRQLLRRDDPHPLTELYIHMRALDQNMMTFFEAGIEIVRQEHFPHLPSRIGMVHVFEQLEIARQFRDRFRQGEATYIQEFDSNVEDPFRADMLLITPEIRLEGDVTDAAAELRRVAEDLLRYWSGEATSEPWIEALLPLEGLQLGPQIE